MTTTTEKARQIDVALAADRRSQRPVDVVPHIRERVDAVRRAYPEATVELDCPDELVVHADWLLGTVLDNLVENAIVHNEGTPSLTVAVERCGQTACIRVTDDGPTIPETELDVFSEGTETPLHHSKGVGLWLVTWVVESTAATSPSAPPTPAATSSRSNCRPPPGSRNSDGATSSLAEPTVSGNI
ncbi:sensor histidine kinase [Halomicroarcula sp. GCM10025710]